MTYARTSESVDIATKEQEVNHDVHNLEEWLESIAGD